MLRGQRYIEKIVSSIQAANTQQKESRQQFV